MGRFHYVVADPIAFIEGSGDDRWRANSSDPILCELDPEDAFLLSTIGLPASENQFLNEIGIFSWTLYRLPSLPDCVVIQSYDAEHWVIKPDKTLVIYTSDRILKINTTLLRFMTCLALYLENRRLTTALKRREEKRYGNGITIFGWQYKKRSLSQNIWTTDFGRASRIFWGLRKQPTLSARVVKKLRRGH